MTTPHEANRLSWNEATRAHNSHKRDQARFLREGGSTIFPEELELLGELRGKRLVHLQCNAGQDTLSLARHGADVTGVDISDEAVRFATELSKDAAIPARFERGDVLQWLPEASARGLRFDVAFSSYGVIGWLSDLDAWARGIAGVLAPGGRFVLVEFHPTAWIFDDQYRWSYPYSSHGQPLKMETGVNDYVASAGEALAPSGFEAGVCDFANPHPTYEFCWGMADVLGALLRAGLVLETFREYPYSNGCKLYREMKTLDGNRFTVPDGRPELPLMFGVAARAR